VGWWCKLENIKPQLIVDQWLTITRKIPCNSAGLLLEGYATGGVSPAKKICQQSERMSK
jgi:hypothetical protein